MNKRNVVLKKVTALLLTASLTACSPAGLFSLHAAEAQSETTAQTNSAPGSESEQPASAPAAETAGSAAAEQTQSESPAGTAGTSETAADEQRQTPEAALAGSSETSPETSNETVPQAGSETVPQDASETNSGSGESQSAEPAGKTETASETAPESEPESEPASEPETDREEGKLVRQTLQAAIYTDGTFRQTGGDDGSITLSGVMPENAAVKAYPVSVNIGGQKVLAAYDITILYKKGNEEKIYEPQEGAIQVAITNSAVSAAISNGSTDLMVYHLATTQAAPAEVSSASMSADTILFEADSFSIYAITDPVSHFTQKYTFLDANGSVFAQHILSDNEVLQNPGTPPDDHQHFKGWYTQDGRKFDGFGKTASQLNGGSLTIDNESNPIILQAKLVEEISVYFMSSSGDDAAVINTQTYAPGDPVKAYDLRDLFKTARSELMGWSVSRNATEPDGNIVAGTDDMHLYPVVGDIHWVDYDSNGGTPVESKYYHWNEATVNPAEQPVKPGYTFEGWYTQKENGDPYPFGGKLDKDITLFAHWKPAETSHYRVLYYIQTSNPKYDSTLPYQLYKIATEKNVLTDSEISAKSYWDKAAQSDDFTKKSPYYGMLTFNEKKSTGNTKVAADGSTVIELYFDRKDMTILFFNSFDACKKYATTNISAAGDIRMQFTGRYGSYFEDDGLTPGDDNPYASEGKNGYWVQYDPSNWIWEFGNGFSFGGAIKSDTMLLYPEEYSNGSKYEIYAETVNNHDEASTAYKDPSHYQLMERGTTGAGYYAFAPKDRATTYYGYQFGYRDNNDENGEITWSDQWDTGLSTYIRVRLNSSKTLVVLEKRAVHTLTFRNAKTDYSEASDIKSLQVKYGTPLASYADEAPVVRPDGLSDYFVFDGWYRDADFIQKADFSKLKMPAHDFVLYAHWVAKDVKVIFHPENGQDCVTVPVKAGQLVAQPEKPGREGYVFTGWVDADNHPFSFASPVTDDLDLYASWSKNAKGYKVIYDLNGGSGPVPTDLISYAEGSKVKAASSNGLVPPTGKSSFLCWMTPDGQAYFPGSNITMGGKDLILKAQWSDGRTTTLTYDYAYNHLTKSIVIDVPNSQYKIMEEDPERTNFKFLGWSAPDGTVYKRGDEIQIDTLEPEKNVLTAQWKRISYTITYNPKGGKWKDGTSGLYDETYSVDTSAMILTAPKRKGFTFLGWKVGSVTYQPGDTYHEKDENGVLTDATLTAQWQKITPDSNPADTQPKEESRKTPNTGDENNLSMWFSLLMAAAAAAVWLAAAEIRKRKMNDR